MTYVPATTLAARLWPERAGARAGRNVLLAVAGSLALALSAKVQVPFYPVPMTMQTLVVLLLGAAYGARLAAATVALYLAEGLVGFPVFAGAVAGPAYMMGPTGGFLVGFVAAAAAIGWLAQHGWARPWSRLIVTMTLGHAIIFAFGFAWLATLMGPEKAVWAGVAPFALATLLKTLLACAVFGAAWGAVARFRRR